jgi:phage tail sheath protein FI
MPVNYTAPDIYVYEVPIGAKPIQAVGTSTAGFLGIAPNAEASVNTPVSITNFSEFKRLFVPEGGTESTPLVNAVRGFFDNGGTFCYICNIGSADKLAAGLEALGTIDEIAIVAAPGLTGASAYTALLDHCENLKDRVAVLDGVERTDEVNNYTRVASEPAAPSGSSRRRGSSSDSGDSDTSTAATTTDLRPRQSEYGAVYYPWITVRDALDQTKMVNVAPSGHIAGIWARTDATRGVHKAPANEIVRGALNVTHRLTRDQHGILNEVGVNAIRFYSGEGVRVMGARTVAAASSEYRYLNVRRLMCMMSESIAKSLRWAIFEPNNIPLWKSVTRDVTAFLIRLWRDGALQGASPEEAFYVKCDAETNPQENIDAGIMTCEIGVAIVKPAEFVVFNISQVVGGAETEATGV